MTDETFEQAARTYGDMLYRVAYHTLRNRADAEDVVQNVLLKLYQQESCFESEDHMKHWLLRVTLDLHDELPPPGDTRGDEVFQAVMALDAKYSLSVYLYYYEGCSVKEAAAAMGVNPSTVQTWLQRARARLRRTLSEEEEGEGPEHVRPQIVP